MADQLLQGGYFEEGVALLLSLFREHDRALPGSQLRMVLRDRWDRARLALRGFRWTERPKREIEPRDRALLALYRAASRGLTIIDPIRAAYFVFRGRRLSMSIGDWDSVTYFAIFEVALRDGGGHERPAALLGVVDELVRSHPDPLYRNACISWPPA